MNLLVIAPHQDDEILSAFLLMHNVLEKNGTVNILYATNGDYRGIDYAYTRYYESLNALSLLGICEDHMLYLGYADTGMSKEKSFLMRLRSTPEQQNSPVSSCTYHPANKETVHSLHTETQAEYTSQNFLDDLVYAIRSCSPSLIAAPSIFDLHGDHYACAMYLYDALRIINHPIKVLSYLIHTENEDVWPNRKVIFSNRLKILPLFTGSMFMETKKLFPPKETLFQLFLLNHLRLITAFCIHLQSKTSFSF